MKRRLRVDRLLALLVALAALGVGIGFARGGAAMMPSYLAAWLFFMAIPLGALPLVMLAELVGAADALILPPLRRMLVLLPIAALFVIPVLLRLGGTYNWAHEALHGVRHTWFEPGFFIGRTVAYLAIWVVLCWLFLWPPRDPTVRGRPGRATLGLVLHLAVGTLAAIDWAMSVEWQLASSLFGLLLISAQCGTAAAVAMLLSGASPLAPLAVPAFALLAVVAQAAWITLHFLQFLIVWSGDKPGEAAWYLHRSHALGAAGEWLGLIAFLAALLLLLFRGRPQPAALAAIALLLLLTHLFEMFWLITPAFRHRFVITWVDGVVMLAAVLVGGTLLVTFSPRPHGRGMHHGTT